MRKEKWLGYLCLAATCILWGTTWVASKMQVKEMTGLQVAGMRQLMAGMMIVGYFVLVRRFAIPNKQQLKQLFLMGLLIFTLANSISTWSLQYIPSGLSSLIGALYPLFVILIERVMYKKKEFNGVTVAGFLLGMTGVAIVFYDNLQVHHVTDFIIGVSMSLAATFSWSLGTVMIVRKDLGMHSFYALGWQMLISSVLVTVIGRWTQPAQEITDISAQGWFLLGYLIVIGSLITFSAFLYSMKVLPHALASIFAYVNPLVAIMLGSWILREPLSIHIIYGSLITLAGIFLVNLSSRKFRQTQDVRS